MTEKEYLEVNINSSLASLLVDIEEGNQLDVHYSRGRLDSYLSTYRKLFPNDKIELPFDMGLFEMELRAIRNGHKMRLKRFHLRTDEEIINNV